MYKLLFCPSGKPATGVLEFAWTTQGEPILDDSGEVADSEWGGGDFPTFERWLVDDDKAILMDEDGNEWLEQHCRLIEVFDGYDQWEHRDAISPWPDDIQSKCSRAVCLADGIKHITDAKERFPQGFYDVTCQAVEAVVVKRASAELAAIHTEIAAWRVVNPEPVTKLEEPEDA